MPGNAQKGNSHRSQGRCRVTQDQGQFGSLAGTSDGLSTSPFFDRPELKELPFQEVRRVRIESVQSRQNTGPHSAAILLQSTVNRHADCIGLPNSTDDTGPVAVGPRIRFRGNKQYRAEFVRGVVR